MPNAFFFKALVVFFARLLLKHFKNPKTLHRSFSNNATPHSKFHKYSFLAHRLDLSDQTLIFSVEGSLLKPQSLFPYFLLVAFEAGSILRALVLFILYPFICFLSHEMRLKIMVMVCFVGIKEESFREGTAVLPKFFLENVGLESFEVLRRSGGKKVGVSDMPRVMVESFLRDYLEIEFVVGRELKVCSGYFVGLMEEKNNEINNVHDHQQVLEDEKKIAASSKIIGISSFNKSLDHPLFSLSCIVLVRAITGCERADAIGIEIGAAGEGPQTSHFFE